MKEHHYAVTVAWTGNRGTGTSAYRAYARDHELRVPGKPVIPGSSEPAFRGDPARWNPEELLVGALSACHKLWYLHLCADAGITVTAYLDRAEGVMVEAPDGSGRFTRTVLRPEVTIAPGSDSARAAALHAEVHAKCALARSVNFEVACEPVIREG